jgi:hypothetical protein
MPKGTPPMKFVDVVAKNCCWSEGGEAVLHRRAQRERVREVIAHGNLPEILAEIE